ncbi:hypothetical protein HELRODRAFT_183257 [Helobdella robusta]|uniref:Uncharacterized protein n=1 Tax=Helobdella robusta TaxID=6412 RepID=T1FJD7_HELRO|nr:hypothetical protein HELRODRAFT_183257 [Helobdella robusta]ESO11377.1 hypothetical protein HELRODRAFT_183257 [Helobdella robusta]
MIYLNFIANVIIVAGLATAALDVRSDLLTITSSTTSAAITSASSLFWKFISTTARVVNVKQPEPNGKNAAEIQQVTTTTHHHPYDKTANNDNISKYTNFTNSTDGHGDNEDSKGTSNLDPGCLNFHPGTLQCYSSCLPECSVRRVNSIRVAEKMKECVFIIGSLLIQISEMDSFLSKK